MDPHRVPVIVGVGQAIEREAVQSATELAERAARAALSDAPGLAERIQRLTMVAVSFSPSGKAPASALARLLGLRSVQCETTRPGGNTPQWLVTRAAAEIAEGRLETTLIAGAEATRSMRVRDPGASALGSARRAAEPEEGEPDPVVGPSLSGMLGEAEMQARLMTPAELYPILESAWAARDGRDFAAQRAYLGGVMAPFTEVAARNPFAWFPTVRTPDEISGISPENRLTAEPYTKWMNSFPNVDLGAALLLTTLAVAREAGLADRCVFPWSGATNADVAPSARPDLADSPAIRAAARAVLDAARIGIDEVDYLDLYSCFPVAVQSGARAIGVALDDPRRLTVTGGMPYFGGPGNDYTAHAIATLVERLRGSGGLGYVAGIGGYVSKHSIGIYGATPPPRGFRAADTRADQERIEAAALPVALEARGPAVVDGATVVHAQDGSVARVPVFARLADGRRVVADAHPSLLPNLHGRCLVGEKVELDGSPPTYRL